MKREVAIVPTLASVGTIQFPFFTDCLGKAEAASQQRQKRRSSLGVRAFQSGGHCAIGVGVVTKRRRVPHEIPHRRDESSVNF